MLMRLTLLRACALTLSLGVFAFLVYRAATFTAHAHRAPAPTDARPAAVATAPSAAMGPPARGRVPAVASSRGARPSYHLRGPATKADPHLFRMYVEEDAPPPAAPR
jgi:hypothetical protein